MKEKPFAVASAFAILAAFAGAVPSIGSTSVGAAPPMNGDLCISGVEYGLAQYDEFAKDKELLSSAGAPAVTSGQVTWSTNGQTGGSVNRAYHDDYGGPRKTITIGSGYLGITASKLAASITDAKGKTYDWASAKLSGPPLTYGYFEVSAKLPLRRGFWPAALWLMSTPYVALGPEIDGEEIFGDSQPKGTVNQTLWKSYSPSVKTQIRHVVADADTTFHSYGILWTPSEVVFYIDRVATSPALPTYTHTPMSAQIGMGVFSDRTWATPPADDRSETMFLQYYRAYQTRGAPCTADTLPSPLR